LYHVAVPYFNQPNLFHDRMDYYANLITRKSCTAVRNVWGFIDGTIRKTCCPSRFQKLAYSGHKRCHGVKFQSVIAPDGLIVCLFGPVPGSRHDSFMLGQSGLLWQLSNLMPEGTPLFSLYGDPAYPQSNYIFGGFRNPPPGSDEAKWNTHMSKVRECVEWGFKEIITQWAYLDFKASMKIFEVPVAQYYVVAAFFTNIRNCIYGSQTMEYFDAVTFQVHEYINLVD